ncbi:hypothetical protein D8B25_07670 [Verminephrobacter aporrectodeae subsp. tuberculatae]|nr:hypothetical protein [Verminephrobacter aporrectodeae subsp. tuberculatae]MCW8202639.1 hypothetical protein [Verminephrobacter aporrectodeae subsp. tuberculatae]
MKIYWYEYCFSFDMLSTTTKPGSSGHTDTLFENLMFSPDSTTAPKPRALKSIPRVQSPVCNQVELRAYDLDFRRRETLKDLLEQAQTQVQALRKELDDNPGAGTRRVRAARQPAAAEREQRVTRALRTVEVIDKRLSGKAAKHSPESIQADGTQEQTERVRASVNDQGADAPSAESASGQAKEHRWALLLSDPSRASCQRDPETLRSAT